MQIQTAALVTGANRPALSHALLAAGTWKFGHDVPTDACTDLTPRINAAGMRDLQVRQPRGPDSADASRRASQATVPGRLQLTRVGVPALSRLNALSAGTASVSRAAWSQTNWPRRECQVQDSPMPALRVASIGTEIGRGVQGHLTAPEQVARHAPTDVLCQQARSGRPARQGVGL